VAVVFAPLSTTVTTATLLGALWTLALVLVNRPMLLQKRSTRAFLGFLGLVELALLAQGVLSTVLAFTSGLTTDQSYTLAGYALTLPFIVPLTVLWGLNDRSRWGAGVVLVGLVTVPAMILRMNTVWDTRA
jgi:hypothetical protein